MLAAPSLQAMPRPIKIAAIFDEDTNMRHDLMFVNAVKSVNKLRGLLRGVTLVGIIPSPVQYLQSLLSLPNTDPSQVPMIRKIPPDNSFIAEKVTCQVASFPFYLCQRFFPKVWLQFLDLAPSATLTTSSQSVITVRFHSSRREAQVGLGICSIWIWMVAVSAIKESGLSGPGPASSLSLHPDPAALGQALVDIVRRSHFFLMLTRVSRDGQVV